MTKEVNESCLTIIEILFSIEFYNMFCEFAEHFFSALSSGWKPLDIVANFLTAEYEYTQVEWAVNTALQCGVDVSYLRFLDDIETITEILFC